MIQITTGADIRYPYLKGTDACNKLRLYSPRQGGTFTYGVIQAHDESYHLVPEPSVIALHHIEDPATAHDAAIGDVIEVDGCTFTIVEGPPLHDVQLAPAE